MGWVGSSPEFRFSRGSGWSGQEKWTRIQIWGQLLSITCHVV